MMLLFALRNKISENLSFKKCEPRCSSVVPVSSEVVCLTEEQLGSTDEKGLLNSSLNYKENSKQYKVIQDQIFGFIEIPLKLINLMNTKEFQRLHYLKQNGSAYMIYPSSNHTRFDHSLGVYYLSTELMKRMEQRLIDFNVQDERIKVYKQLCQLVQVAALLHDIGHGCFSHLFENFTKQYGFKQNHEEVGKIITQKLLKRQGWDDKDIKIIQNLIDGEVKNIQEYFEEFQFLTLIVHNSVSNLDTDKIEYIIRDSRQVGIKVAVDWQRIIQNTELIQLQDINGKVKFQFSYNRNILYEVQQVFEARMCLNKKLYNHPKSIACDLLVLDILTYAQEHKIFDFMKYLYDVTDEQQTEFQYYPINDQILSVIDMLNQTQYHDKTLQEYFDRLETHKIYKTLLVNSFDAQLFGDGKDIIQQQLQKELQKVHDSARVVVRSIDFGMKAKNPLNYIPQSGGRRTPKISQQYFDTLERVYGIELKKEQKDIHIVNTNNFQGNNFRPSYLQEYNIFVYSTLKSDDENSDQVYKNICEKVNQCIEDLKTGKYSDICQHMHNSISLSYLD